jgi:tetratricopeptide (TPR) repeat protein
MTAPSQATMPSAVPRIWGNVPQRNKNFTGRESLLEQLRRDPSTVTAVLPQALHGMGGVGKTAVAIEYAHRYASEYELVWWIPADQLALVRSSLAALAEPLGLAAAAATGVEGAAAAVLDALRRGEPHRRWLLIFDNADQPEELNDIIPRGPGDVLITSRNHRWDAVVETAQVDVFDRKESTDFLNRRVPGRLTPEDTNRLAAKLGDLPLALEQAGALLAEAAMSADEYIHLLEEQISAILAEGKPPEYPLSMTAAWQLSVTTLRKQQPQAVELLRCCAFFGPDPIPRDVFRRSSRATETRVSGLIADPIMLATAIRELARFALVRIDGRMISIHRLVQALIRDALEPDERPQYRHEAHLIIAAGAPESPNDNRVWSAYRELLPHVTAPSTDLATCRDSRVRSFSLDVVRYLYLAGDFASSVAYADRFIEQWTKDSAPDDPNILDAQRHRGNALRGLGQYSEAFVVVERTLKRSRQILGEQNPLTLALRNSFGADLRARGDFAAAQQLDDNTRRLHEEVFGTASPQTLRVMNNLALDYGLNSDYQAARLLLQRTYLLQSEATSGVSPTEVLGSWNGLAWATRLCGNYIGARDVGEDARDYGEERLGAEHYVTLRTANTLSVALRFIENGREEALSIAEQVFNWSTRLRGEGHPDTLAAAISLTNAQRVLGNLADAISLAEVAVARYPDIYGADHPYNYGCIGNLALLRRRFGDASEARRLNETALIGLDNRLTRNHHYSLTVAANLASDFAALGEVSAARALGEQTLKALRELMGEDFPLTLGCAANLALDLRADGADADADLLTADTMSRYTRTLGNGTPDVADAAAGRRLDFDFDPPGI